MNSFITRKDRTFYIGLSLQGAMVMAPTASEPSFHGMRELETFPQTQQDCTYVLAGNFFSGIGDQLPLNFTLETTTETVNNKIVNEGEYFEQFALLHLKEEFAKELASRSDFLTIHANDAQEQFNYMAAKIATLKYEDYSVELVKFNAVKFTLKLTGNRTLRINKSFLNLDNQGLDQIVYSLFENRKLIEANTNTLDEFIDDFQEYMSV